jgi:RNA methyltransferase, RsmE family
MQRYFLKEYPENGRTVRFSGDEYHHIVRVMRMSKGDRLAAVFPGNRTAICEVLSIGTHHVEAEIRIWLEEERELPVDIICACALLKGDKFDWVIQKGTEMGARQFIPVAMERSIVKVGREKGIQKQLRWQKIAKEAAEQAERTAIPEVFPPCSFEECLKMARDYPFRLAAYEEEGRSGERNRFPSLLKQLTNGDSLFLLFGPEGGFSRREIGRLREERFVLCGLGPRILRAETAPLYALSAISFYFELLR